jgi:Raf kinase inhibitor-like YbhB/YbcL family protein
VVLAGCGGSSKTTSAASSGGSNHSSTTATPPAGVRPGQRLAPGFQLTSSAFHPNGSIPARYTCDGGDLSLPLRWSSVPAGTKELVIVMRDPDAPGGTFVHWALAGISPAIRSFPSGGVTGQVIPGRNSFGSLGYRGPCPPRGEKAHHYVITLSALAGASGLHSGFTPDQLRTRALALATLIGIYRRR